MVSEMPQAGDLVGLDAEFVTLNQVSLDYNTTVCLPHCVAVRLCALKKPGYVVYADHSYLVAPILVSDEAGGVMFLSISQ